MSARVTRRAALDLTTIGTPRQGSKSLTKTRTVSSRQIRHRGSRISASLGVILLLSISSAHQLALVARRSNGTSGCEEVRRRAEVRRNVWPSMSRAATCRRGGI